MIPLTGRASKTCRTAPKGLSRSWDPSTAKRRRKSPN
nr:MAG TPA: hypothetical protein [Caudoviricetes sp.]